MACYLSSTYVDENLTKRQQKYIMSHATFFRIWCLCLGKAWSRCWNPGFPAMCFACLLLKYPGQEYDFFPSQEQHFLILSIIVEEAIVTVFGWRLVPPALQWISLLSLQLQPPATSQVTIFFSHTTLAPASSSSLPNTGATNVWDKKPEFPEEDGVQSWAWPNDQVDLLGKRWNSENIFLSCKIPKIFKGASRQISVVQWHVPSQTACWSVNCSNIRATDNSVAHVVAGWWWNIAIFATVV